VPAALAVVLSDPTEIGVGAPDGSAVKRRELRAGNMVAARAYPTRWWQRACAPTGCTGRRSARSAPPRQAGAGDHIVPVTAGGPAPPRAQRAREPVRQVRRQHERTGTAVAMARDVARDFARRPQPCADLQERAELALVGSAYNKHDVRGGLAQAGL
jgi:hypothetical protein